MYGLIGIAVLLCGLNGACKETIKDANNKQAEESAEKETAAENLPEIPAHEGINAFACDLYTILSETQGNLFFSPYSISTALAMTYAGARGNTAEEMATVLHFDRDQDRFHTSFAEVQNRINTVQVIEGIQLSAANSLWLQKNYTFLQHFLNVTKEKYGAGFFTVNFAQSEPVRKKINLWVADKTEQKIQNLIKKGMINRQTRCILTNAIYFKGMWKTKFDTSRTRERQFYLDGENTVTVPFMYKSEMCNYRGDSTVQVLELPYEDRVVSLFILLPRAKEGLSKLDQSLSASMLNEYMNTLYEQKVNIFLPKFTVTLALELKKTLLAMGMKLAFSGKADFSGMTKKKELFIDEVVHKAYIDVHEEGTEAAAATAVTMRKLSMPTPPEEFLADHPFIFFIRENSTGTILFIGRLINPKNEV